MSERYSGGFWELPDYGLAIEGYRKETQKIVTAGRFTLRHVPEHFNVKAHLEATERPDEDELFPSAELLVQDLVKGIDSTSEGDNKLIAGVIQASWILDGVYPLGLDDEGNEQFWYDAINREAQSRLDGLDQRAVA